MEWSQRVEVERMIKRAVKRLNKHVQNASDNEAIHILRLARSAVKYRRTFTEQLAVEASRPRRRR